MLHVVCSESFSPASFAALGEIHKRALRDLQTAELGEYPLSEAAKFDKPKDFMGLDKSLPPEEMKKLLLANIQVTDKDLQRLADARRGGSQIHEPEGRARQAVSGCLEADSRGHQRQGQNHPRRFVI